MGKEIIKSDGEIAPPVITDLTKAFEEMGQLINRYVSEQNKQNIFQRDSDVILPITQPPINESTEPQKS